MPPENQETRLLITAGPTHEPIDDVRYVANRSSGRLGIALADAAAARSHPTTLLLGPTHLEPSNTCITLHRFRTAADLQALLATHFPHCDVLIMAAAVADYRPRRSQDGESKIRRAEGPLALTLEPTPDLLAECAKHKRAGRGGQRTVGFALEPTDRLETSALDKLKRKHLDAIVANPLETMDADTIQATLYIADGAAHPAPSPISKADFAAWLLDRIAALLTKS